MAFGDWLAGLGREELATLLRMRPDAMAAPQPLTLGELAERLALPHGVLSTLAEVDLPSFQVLEALAALGDGAPRAEVMALLAGEGEDEPAGFQGLLSGLFRRALAWPEGAALRLAEPLREWPVGDGPLGLGPPAAALLPRLTADALRRIGRELGVPVTGRRKEELVSGALRVLGDRDRIRAVVAEAPWAVRALLDKAARQGTADLYQPLYFPPRVRDDDPYGWAVTRGLLIQLDWLPAVMPAEVALALRGRGYRAPFTPVEPVPPTLPLPPHADAAEFGAVASRAVEEVTRLISLCEKEPPTRLKSGGVGVRELRRAAKAAACVEDAARLWLELASAADLVAWHDARLVPTAAFDGWQTDEPAGRLVSLVRSWRQMTRLPLLDHPDAGRSAPLEERAHDPAAPRLRAGVLEALAALPPDEGARGPEALTAMVTWRRPMLFEDAELAPPYLAAIWREANLLGLVAHGALTPAGRALLGDAAEFERVVAAALAPACTTVVLQADLTAVVPGPPSARLADLLDGLADRETQGTASTWRFGPASIRRALDAGRTAEELLSELRAVAERDLPQPLEYMVNDIARRHGEVTVIPLACAICCPRPALLTEIRAHRRLSGLGLRELAPTVLSSAKPMTETLRALRDAGYVPVGRDAAGVPLIERAPRRRADPAPPRRPAGAQGAKPATRRATTRRASPGYGPDELAERLQGLYSGSFEPPEPAAPPGPAADRLAEVAAQLSGTERRLLAHALDTGAAVRIDYVNADGNASSRVIENAELDKPFLTAWCRLRDDQRVFHMGRITAVAPAT